MRGLSQHFAPSVKCFSADGVPEHSVTDEIYRTLFNGDAIVIMAGSRCSQALKRPTRETGIPFLSRKLHVETETVHMLAFVLLHPISRVLEEVEVAPLGKR